jgi:hypothetical protein
MSKTFGFTGFKLKSTEQKDSSKPINSKLQSLYPLPTGLKPTGAVVSTGLPRKHKTEEE